MGRVEWWSGEREGGKNVKRVLASGVETKDVFVVV